MLVAILAAPPPAAGGPVARAHAGDASASPAGTTPASSTDLPPPPDIDVVAEARADAARQAAPRAGLLPALAAVVPGVVVHGSGHWVAGDRCGAGRQLAIEGVALGVTAAGVIPLVATGASRKVVAYAVPLTIGGVGLFLVSWASDIYGAAGGGARRVAPRTRASPIAASVGYAHVRDPQFEHGHFAVVDADARHGRLRVSPSAWIATDADMQRLRLEGAYRLLGPRPDRAARDGSHAELQLAGTLHRAGDDAFSILIAEVSARGRLDLDRIGVPLRGSFAEVELGWGVESYLIDGAETTVQALQLARFGHGIYLGDPARRHGEILLYYDHRHDALSGGLGTGQPFDGPWGHVGLSGWYSVLPGWSVVAQLEAGSAYVSRLSLRWEP
jgi:hypothetical protein